MLENIPVYIELLFVFSTFAALGFFYLVLRKSIGYEKWAQIICLVLVLWLILQGVLSYQYFYSSHPNSRPPRFLFLIFPPLVTIIFLFASKNGRSFLDSLPIQLLTYIHIVRIPVEWVLYALFLEKAVPELMTFDGRNFDILAGITAPFVAYLGLQKRLLSPKFVLWWDIFALALLLNIVAHGILSAPSAFQQLAFDQPNKALLHFPFTWLPGFIVPLVLFAHLVSIRRLRAQLRKR
jgi:hypothetical protein